MSWLHSDKYWQSTVTWIDTIDTKNLAWWAQASNGGIPMQISPTTLPNGTISCQSTLHSMPCFLPRYCTPQACHWSERLWSSNRGVSIGGWHPLAHVMVLRAAQGRMAMLAFLKDCHDHRQPWWRVAACWRFHCKGRQQCEVLYRRCMGMLASLKTIVTIASLGG